MTIEQLKSELVAKENLYGGICKKVKRRSVSPHDPRSTQKLSRGGMRGGDRMADVFHGYAEIYAQYLLKFLEKQDEDVIVEVGILRGSGVATWCDLFPHNFVYGLDIDLSHIEDNMSFLEERGAFKNDNLKLYEYDQFLDNTKYLAEILEGRKIKIMIDDGFHSDLTILNTIDSSRRYLAEDFVYLIEDNRTVRNQIQNKYSQFSVFYENQLTILTPK